MELRDWVQDRFGAADETLLQESVYSTRELRKDKAKLEQNLKQLENDMQTHGKKYKKLLEKGAEADDMSRSQYAQKAKFEKKKYEIKKKKHKANTIKLGTIISIEGMREILEMQDGEDMKIDKLMSSDINAQEVQSQIMDQMAEFGLELEDMQQIQDALDVPIMDDDLETGASEEMELMEEMAAGDISGEQIDVEADLNDSEEDVDIGSIDIEDDGLNI
jgi:hypothetical protein